MLSVANSPGPPCPPNVPALNSDERANSPERPSSPPEADLAADLDEAQRPQFSIRDYVFTSRSKHIGTNWPFPQRYLQLCLKHGVRDILPPFEPPDLLRARFSEKCAETDHLVGCWEVEGTQTEVGLVRRDSTDLSDTLSDVVKHDFSPLNHELALGSSDLLQNPLSDDKSPVVRAVVSKNELYNHGQVESKVIGPDHTRNIPSSVSEYPRSVQEARSVSESSVEVAKFPPLTEKIRDLCEPSVKKCRLIVKFGGPAEPNQTEDTVSNLSSVSDPMASKVCPVCKTFSSTSNTTLNAHMDQCLCAESSAKRVVIKLSQRKVKPRKKRSMDEICATAPRCTLEDLDRRNGTNWALDLTSMAQNKDAPCTTESKRPRISLPKDTDDEREGTVYIDSNGTKLLILSKVNDTPPAAAVDCSGHNNKLRKEFRSKRSSLVGKKKRFSRKYNKYWKAKLQRKKLSSFNHLKGEIHKEGKFHVDTQLEKEKIPQASNAQEQVKINKPGTLGQWICSKRSSLFKSLNSKLRRRKPGNPLTMTHDMSVEGDRSVSCDRCAIGEHIQKYCNSSDEILSSMKTKSTDVMSNAVLASINQEKHSASLHEKNARSMGNNSTTSKGIKLKLSRSTGIFASFEKSKRVGINANVVQKSGKFQNSAKIAKDCYHQLPKAKMGSRRSQLVDGTQRPFETIKYNKVVQGIVSKKLRKRRFVENAHREASNLPLELIERSHDSPSAHDLGSASNSVTTGMHQSNFSGNIVLPETSDTNDYVSPSQSNEMDSNQDDADYHASEGGEYMDYSQLGVECHHAEVIKLNANTEVSANAESLVKCLLEKSADTCGSKAVTSENHEATICDRLDSYASPQQPREPSGANEATVVACIQKLLGDQGMHHGVTSSDTTSQDIWQAGQMELSVKGSYCSELLNLEHRADFASIQGSSACLTRPADKILEVGNRSLVTSDSTVAAHWHSIMIADGEPSGSPISATSTVSHLSAEDLNSIDAEREPSVEPVVIQEKARSCSSGLGLLADESIGTERTDLDNTTKIVKADAYAQEREKFCDDQPCCCSRRETFSGKPKIFKQSFMTGMMLPTRTKKMTSSLYTRPVMASSGVYSHSRSEAMAVPILDTHTDSLSATASPNFAPRAPTFNNCGAANSASYIQPQTTSSPVLRLMGKNLMVMNSEETPEQLQNQAASCSFEGTSNTKYVSLLEFASTSSFSDQDHTQYIHHQCLEGSMLGGWRPSNIQAPVPLPANHIDHFAGTLLQSGLRMKADSHAPQKRLDTKPDVSGLYNMEKVYSPHGPQKPIPVSRAAIPERELIVIDDSPEREAEPSQSMENAATTLSPTFSGSDVRRVRHLSCFPSQNLFPPRELRPGLNHGFPISRPRTNAQSAMWGFNSEPSTDPVLPRPFVVPSPSAGQQTPTL